MKGRRGSGEEKKKGGEKGGERGGERVKEGKISFFRSSLEKNRPGGSVFFFPDCRPGVDGPLRHSTTALLVLVGVPCATSKTLPARTP